MPFLTKLVVSSEPTSSEMWVVEAPLVYFTHLGTAITVPVGYSTDLASVPRFAWRIVRPDHPTARRAAVVHDFIYTNLTDVYLKRHADEIFHEALLEDGTNRFLAYLMYCAVRIGGKGNWSK